MNNSKVYVGGLPFKTTEEELKAHFAQAGNVVSVMIARDKMMNNRSRGFGFIEFSTEDEAQKAINMFHDQDFDGRRLLVNIAKPMEKRERSTGGYEGGNNGGYNRTN
jgi:RNA recognition motif-containing protein